MTTQSILHATLFLSTLVALAVPLANAAPPAPADDPVFDMPAIMGDPTEVKILSAETTNGVVFQTLEFTTRLTNGSPERIQGLYAFPEGGRNLPGVFWSMGGMAAASRMFPGILASNGYACLAITLPHKLRNSFRTAFDAKNPKSANMSLLARDQLRGITVLSQRPEVDPNRLAVAGASYGGVFATLLAGADPRIKAGFSFFGAGHHDRGTSLPQFLKMETPDDVGVWNRTFDPAFRLKQRNIPFMWGVAFNDHWFLFPAVAQTYLETAGTDKRLVIMPYWQHGFPAQIDETLLHFLDTTPVSAHPRPAYNAPGPVEVREVNGKAVASFSWTGQNPAAKAELIVSYGENTPWLGWPKRAAFVFPAAIEGNRATAQLPIPSRQLPLIVWGNLTDTNQVTVSTPPLTLSAETLSGLPVVSNLELNCFIDGNLGEEAVSFCRQSGEPLAGELEKDAACSGGQAFRVGSPESGQTTGKVFTILEHFQNVPGLAHRLTVRLKAERPANLSVTLTPVRPHAWGSAVVKQLVAKDPRLAPLLPRWADAAEPIAVTSAVGTAWQDVTLAVPKPTAPVDGYKLEIAEKPESRTTFWIDSLLMQPVWPD